MRVVSGYGLAANHDGRLEIVTIEGPGKAVADRVSTFYQEHPNGDWSGWSALGRPDSGLVADTPPAIARNADGRLEAAVVGGDFTIRHVYQERPGGEWSGWWSLGNPETEAPVRVFGPVLAQNSDGRLELFVQGGDGAVWHRWQTTASTLAWGPWSSLGQPGGHDCGILKVAQNSDGRLELFTVARDGAVWHRWQRSAGGGWAPWSSLEIPPASAEEPMFVGDLAVAGNQDGRLELFAVASDSAVWHRWQRRAGGWAAWSLLGGFHPSSPSWPLGRMPKVGCFSSLSGGVTSCFSASRSLRTTAGRRGGSSTPRTRRSGRRRSPPTRMGAWSSCG